MGWTYVPFASMSDIIREQTANSNYAGKNGSQYARKCLAHCVRGRVLWTVWELTETAKDGTTKKDRYIGCDLLDSRNGEVGYKEMEESMGPCFYSCPLTYLEMAPETNKNWREQVRAYHARRSEATKKVAALKIGDTITLKPGCTPSVLTVTSLHPLMGSVGCVLYRIKKTHLS